MLKSILRKTGHGRGLHEGRKTRTSVDTAMNHARKGTPFAKCTLNEQGRSGGRSGSCLSLLTIRGSGERKKNMVKLSQLKDEVMLLVFSGWVDIETQLVAYSSDPELMSKGELVRRIMCKELDADKIKVATVRAKTVGFALIDIGDMVRVVGDDSDMGDEWPDAMMEEIKKSEEAKDFLAYLNTLCEQYTTNDIDCWIEVDMEKSETCLGRRLHGGES